MYNNTYSRRPILPLPIYFLTLLTSQHIVIARDSDFRTHFLELLRRTEKKEVCELVVPLLFPFLIYIILFFFFFSMSM